MEKERTLRSSESQTKGKASSTKRLPKLRLGHTADWHLRPSQFSRKQRGEHFFKGALSSLEKAKAEGLKYILNSGDILDKNRQRTCNIKELLFLDGWLKKNGMTMYTISGNHDMDTPTWLETLFGGNGDELGIVPVDGRTIIIPGTSYRVKGYRGHKASELLQELETTPAEDTPEIGLWHGGIDGFMGFSAYDVDMKQLLSAAPSMVILAVGDLHIHGYVHTETQVGGYPGSTEMCSISEKEEKYLSVLEIEEGKGKFVKRITLDTTPVYRVHCTSEEEVGKLTQLKKTIALDDFSLVHLVYSSGFVEPARDFARSLDEGKVIIRRKRLSNTLSYKKGEVDLACMLRSPVELVPGFVSTTDEFHSYALRLADKNFDPRVVVEQLVQEYAPEAFRSI